VLCRKLVQAGYPSDAQLQVYRGDTCALTVLDIGTAAGLTVKSSGRGAPIFAREKGATASYTATDDQVDAGQRPLPVLEAAE